MRLAAFALAFVALTGAAHALDVPAPIVPAPATQPAPPAPLKVPAPEVRDATAPKHPALPPDSPYAFCDETKCTLK